MAAHFVLDHCLLYCGHVLYYTELLLVSERQVDNGKYFYRCCERYKSHRMMTTAIADSEFSQIDTTRMHKKEQRYSEAETALDTRRSMKTFSHGSLNLCAKPPKDKKYILIVVTAGAKPNKAAHDQ